MNYCFGLLLVISIGLAGCGGAPETGTLVADNQPLPPIPDVVGGPPPVDSAEEPAPGDEEDAGPVPDTDEGIDPVPAPETPPQVPVFPDYPEVPYDDDLDDYVPDDDDRLLDDDLDDLDDEVAADPAFDPCSVLEQVTGH